MDKHSSLLQKSINYACKRFFSTGPGSTVVEFSTHYLKIKGLNPITGNGKKNLRIEGIFNNCSFSMFLGKFLYLLLLSFQCALIGYKLNCTMLGCSFGKVVRMTCWNGRKITTKYLIIEQVASNKSSLLLKKEKQNTQTLQPFTMIIEIESIY